MLERVISLYLVIFVLVLFAMCGAMFIGVVSQWYALQSEAQFIAAGMGRYGGYTTDLDAQLKSFMREMKMDPAKAQVKVSPSGGPVPWGRVVTCQITYPFRFSAGSFFRPFEVPVTGKGTSVSAYIPGTLSGVSYTTP
ncbi:MAG: hypothetical protein IMW96_10970 [Thermoanaerobacteraceae bacterium]|nr:hypothetical protein [Thermoanaerobacteraceae bacterium]